MNIELDEARLCSRIMDDVAEIDLALGMNGLAARKTNKLHTDHGTHSVTEKEIKILHCFTDLDQESEIISKLSLPKSMKHTDNISARVFYKGASPKTHLQRKIHLKF
jgi:hypothetical protein